MIHVSTPPALAWEKTVLVSTTSAVVRSVFATVRRPAGWHRD